MLECLSRHGSRIGRALALVMTLVPADAALADEADVARRIYDHVMAAALGQDVAWSTTNPEKVGKQNPYRKGKRHKALAACLFVHGDAVNRIEVHSSIWGFGYPVSNRARNDVMRECRTQERDVGCTCYPIDVNDGNVVASQADLMARVK